VPTSDYVPSVDQVARKILSRTKDKFGNEVGTFDENTRPTDTQVANIIDDCMTEIADMIGDDIPEDLWDDAAQVSSIRAAMWVELNYYSDQVNTGRSIYPQLKEEYDAKIKELTSAVTRAIEGGGSVAESGPSGRALYAFPSEPPSIGLRTVM
jgi:hypothetical protein